MNETPEKNDVPTMTFSDFLENCPPNRQTVVSDLWRLGNYASKNIQSPELTLQCTQESCQGPMLFKGASSSPHWNDRNKSKPGISVSLSYQCKNCEITQKLFSLLVLEYYDENYSGLIVKLGEWPPFGPRTPNRLLKMLGDDKELFLLGRRAENQGLGIGAFTYYRRVVENQKDRLIDEIIQVVQKVEDSPDDIVADLINAKKTFQFSQSIKDIKLGIPKIIEIKGHNPLRLLHSALSAGIHDKSDAECLEIARSIRLVLADLVEKLGLALAQKRDLHDAVSKLLQAGSGK